MAVHIDEHSNGQKIELPIGEVLEVSLDENPTTGFRWNLESSGEPVCTLVKDFFETAAGAPGQGGRHHWQFKGMAAGERSIELAYRRAWDRQGAAAKTFRLRVYAAK